MSYEKSDGMYTARRAARFVWLLLGSTLFTLPAARAAEQLIQVTEDFSEDPGWDNYQNRMICTDCPKVEQDFGWNATNHTGAGPGEIGGRVNNSRIQAYYALPFGKPFSFADELSASGVLSVTHVGLRGVAYIGFFNPERHTWRIWSSMAFRIWEEDMLGQVMFDWMTSDFQAGGMESAVLFEPDGKPHRWSFHYEPDARPDAVWRDKALEPHITDRDGNGQPYELQGEEFIFERAKKDIPDLTTETLHQRLVTLRAQGLVTYFHRHGQHRWWKNDQAADGHGRVTLKVDDDEYVIWFNDNFRNGPAAFTHFGLFNIQRYGNWVGVHLGDLVVNGQKIDLSQDPHWDSKNNRASWTEPAFQAMSDYGWAETNWAGKAPGEIGGLFWRTDPPDPLISYYGDDIGNLTLDDPIEFSGNIYFLGGMTDAAGYFGYFNSKEQIKIHDRNSPQLGAGVPGMMGLAIADASSVGYYLSGGVSANDGHGAAMRGPVFTPGYTQRKFTFKYDPAANNNVGRVVFTIDGVETAFDLTPDMRKAGATMDRFGFAPVRSGGNSVEFFLDDLTYTARRDPSAPRKRYEQNPTPVNYPHKSGGRTY